MQCFSGCTYFWRLHSSFLSLLCSHFGNGSLTAAAAAELDGFDLLWLEKTLILWTHKHRLHFIHIFTLYPNIHLHFSMIFIVFVIHENIEYLTKFTVIYTEHTHTESHICLIHTVECLLFFFQEVEQFLFNLDHCSTWWLEVIFYFVSLMKNSLPVILCARS